MDITVLTHGSRGDVQPYVALAQGLKSAGHRLRVAADISFKDFIRDHDLEYSPAGDYVALLKEKMGRWLEGKTELVRGVNYARWLAPQLPSLLDDWWKASEGADAVIYTPTAFGGYHIAEKLGVPGFSALVNPPLTPTRTFSSCYLPFTPNLGKTFNWFTHVFSSLGIWLPFRKVINRWRKESLNLPPLSFFGPFSRANAAKTVFLYGFSPSIIPPAPDWGDNVHVTGYWFVNNKTGWHPPKELLEFLQAGPPPVYIGFGSMVPHRRAALTRLTLAALERAGQRGIILSGWGGLLSERLPPFAFSIDYADHTWLFPRMATIVHHGGSGTTAATFRAGVPSTVVAFWIEQEYWGRKIASLGVGLKPLSYRRLTPEKLGGAISAVVENRSMHEQADALARKIRSEDGIKQAVDIINKYLSHEKRSEERTTDGPYIQKY